MRSGTSTQRDRTPRGDDGHHSSSSDDAAGSLAEAGQSVESNPLVQANNLALSSSFATGAGTDVPPTPGSMTPVIHTRKNYTQIELLGLFAVSFSYAFVFNTLNTVVIPKEIERLTNARQSMWVGTIMAAGAFSQLATPVVGAWSDRGGIRTPFLIYGTLIVIVGIVLFLVVGTLSDIVMLFLAHIVTTVGLSVQYSMLTAMLHDYVSEEQMGRGSGAIAILAIIGSGAGYAMFAASLPLSFSYCSYILATVFCLGCTITHIPLGEPISRHLRRPHGGITDVLMALSVPSPYKYPDFFFACLSRSMFNTGLAGQVYLVYYMRDVLMAEDAVQITAWVAVMALLGGVVGALPSGILADRVGKKPVIYGAIAVCIVSLLLFMVMRSIKMMYFTGFIYGMGNVAYLSVDYALGVQALPKRFFDATPQRRLSMSSGTPEKRAGMVGVPLDAAKDLGVFAMSSTMGQLLGQVIYGAVLDAFGTPVPTGTQYSHVGFITIYALAGLSFFAAGLCAKFIKGVD